MRSFRARILLGFLVLKLVLIGWILTYLTIDKKTEQLEELKYNLNANYQEFSSINRHLQGFLIRGFRNPDFYRSSTEGEINTFFTRNRANMASLEAMGNDFADRGIKLNFRLNAINTANQMLSDSVKVMLELFRKRGYVNYGLEGKMRTAAHAIEELEVLDRAEILQLRRHEKDFLRRNSEDYVYNFNQLLNTHLKNQQIPAEHSKLLATYSIAFNDLVEIERQLGVSNYSGVYRHVQQLIAIIENGYAAAVSEANFMISSSAAKLRIVLWWVSGLAIPIAIGFSFFFASSLTRDIRLLIQKVLSFKKSSFRTAPHTPGFHPQTREIYHLNREFEQMAEELAVTLEKLEEDRAQAEQNSKSKSLFLANMSHEIRTPLNGITGMLHALKSTDLSHTQNDYVELMDYSANHLFELVNMILDYSKIDAGRMKLENIEFDLKGDLEKLMRIFELKSSEKGVQLKFETQGDTTRMILGDSLRLQQVLINLVNNALKFTKKGEVCLSVEQTQLNVNFQTLRFAVTDTGIGISHNQITRLFEAFEQQDSSITRKFGGTGLGLTICNGLVQLMGSELKVESREGHGSVFSFEVKFELGREKTSFAKTLPNTAEVSLVETRVLIAEDNVVNQKVLTLMLEQMGAIVELAENGVEAVQKFRAGNYDLVLMDVQMPEMDGMQATRAIHESFQYRLSPVPIIAVTANAFSEDRKAALAAGMDDFISKPVKPQELRGILGKYTQLLATGS